MSTFSKGDKAMRVAARQLTEATEEGVAYTVRDISGENMENGVIGKYILLGEIDQWVLASHYVKVEPEDADDVEPEPLKEGDWVQVWAQIEAVDRDSEGEVTVRLPRERGLENAEYVLADAIVRPEAGQVPPWVKPLRTEAEALAEVMGCDNHGVTYGVCVDCLAMAERVLDAGYRREGGAS